MKSFDPNGDYAWKLLCARLGRDPETSEESDTCSLRSAWKAMVSYAAIINADNMVRAKFESECG